MFKKMPRSSAKGGALWTDRQTAVRPWFSVLSEFIGESLRMRRWWWRLGLLAVMLAVTDAVVYRIVPPPDFEDDYVLPYNSLARLGQVVEHIRSTSQSGKKVVVFLGDSSFKSRIPRGAKNLPEYYAELLKQELGEPVSVYNISTAGLDLASRYYIARELAPFVPVIIFNINFRVFTPEPQERVAYSGLWREIRPRVSAEDHAHLQLDRGEGGHGWVFSVEDWLERGLSRSWVLWDRRIELKDLFLQFFHPRNWLIRAAAAGRALIAGSDRHAAPVRLPLDEWNLPIGEFSPELKQRVMQAYVAACPNVRMNEDSADAYFLRKLYGLSNSHRCVLIGIMSPFSRWLNERLHYYNEGIYTSNVRMLRSLSGGKRNLFIDYNAREGGFDPVPGDRYFQLYEHLVGEGNRMFARRLYADTRTTVLRALR